MHPPDMIQLSHLAQWAAIIGGGIAGWATLRRMRTNELRHLEEKIESVWKVVNDIRDRVSRIEGWRNGLKGGSPGGK